jgi:hypothetical protein
MVNRWCSVAAGCAVFLGIAGRADAASRPSIVLVVYDQAGVAPATLTRAKLEVGRIVDDAGVDVIWIAPAAAEPANTFAIRLLIRRRDVGATVSAMGTAIGDVHESGGTAFVFFDQVLRSAHGGKHDAGSVLAYAMAHEMGHLLLPGPAHAESGIMRPSWDGDDLRHIADGSMQFTPVQQRAIRAKASTCCIAAAARP